MVGVHVDYQDEVYFLAREFGCKTYKCISGVTKEGKGITLYGNYRFVQETPR